MERLRNHCTLLVVAHRFSTVRAANRVIVLDNGRVDAIGTHEELITSSSYYRGLAAESFPDATMVPKPGGTPAG